MASKIRLASVDEIPEGKAIIVKGPDDYDIALFKLKGKIYALDNACPHQGGPLGEGELEEDIIVCPWHGYRFNICSGLCENSLCEDARTIPIELVDGIIYLND